MPRGIRKKTRQYVLERFQDEDPESYFKYKVQSSRGLSHEQMEFLEALSNKSVNVVKGFLNRGMDPHFTILPGRHTPLHLAIAEHRPDDVTTEKIVRALLFFGADPNAQDDFGNTPLHTACFTKTSVCVQLLIDAGADINRGNWNHETPLMSSCSLKDPSFDIVKILTDNGADIDVISNGKQNVLHLLCSADLCRTCDFDCRARVASHLLQQGLPSDAVDSNDKTPLCYELLRLVYLYSTTHSASDNETASFSRNSTKVALAIVEGGGLTNFKAHRDDLTSFIDTLTLFPGAHCVLHSFFLSVRTVLPVPQYNQICDWIARPKHTIFSVNHGARGGQQVVIRRPVTVTETEGNSQTHHGRAGAPDVGGDDGSGSITGAAEVRGGGGGGASQARGGSLRIEETDNDEVCNNLYNTLALHTPPTLLSMSKTVIRCRLGGRLTVTTQLLGLPTKMENYIKSMH